MAAIKYILQCSFHENKPHKKLPTFSRHLDLVQYFPTKLWVVTYFETSAARSNQNCPNIELSKFWKVRNFYFSQKTSLLG